MRHDLHIAGHAFRLRPVAASDAPFIVSLRTRAGAFLNRGATTVDEQARWLQSYFGRDGDFYFVVEPLDAQRSEGLVGIHDVRHPEGTAQWGRWVLEPGSNAAVESALLVYRCAFDMLALEWIRCRTLVANASVVGFHDHCGLRRTSGTVMIEHNGQAQPAIEHTLCKADATNVITRLDRLASRFAATRMRAT